MSQGPILDNTRTHLQKSLGDDNVLVVKFSEERNGWNLRTSAQEANDLYGKFGKEGIRVGLRLYRFFGNLFLVSLLCMFFPPLYCNPEATKIACEICIFIYL